jgi:hypothetical protein
VEVVWCSNSVGRNIDSIIRSSTFREVQWRAQEELQCYLGEPISLLVALAWTPRRPSLVNSSVLVDESSVQERVVDAVL